jgi:cytochrome subunit of sulfide dehydrogenase
MLCFAPPFASHSDTGPLSPLMPLSTKRTRTAGVTALSCWPLAIILASCRDLPTAAPDARASDDAPPRPAVVAVNLAGQALAANCFQCHGTDGVAGELKIAGESAAEIISELNEMRLANPRRSIMNLHAAAYTPAEISLIADYFSRQGN